jgi:hypothetical protein
MTNPSTQRAAILSPSTRNPPGLRPYPVTIYCTCASPDTEVLPSTAVRGQFSLGACHVRYLFPVLLRSLVGVASAAV